MLENHFIRLAYNETYICKLYEEIIACSEETKEILYLISIVESAENDLLQMCNAWVDPKMSEEKLDFFTPQKLEYFCVKTMKALNYLHKQNIYYGDMKPQNILIFKDYKVKFGDFGCAIKFSNDSSYDTKTFIRGVTKGFSSKEMVKAHQDGEAVTKKQLFENDCLCLYETFKIVFNRLKHMIPSSSRFNEILIDLGNSELSLDEKVTKWEAKFFSD